MQTLTSLKPHNNRFNVNWRLTPKAISVFILFYTIVMGTLTDVFGWPAYISFFNDFLLLIVLLFGFKQISHSFCVLPKLVQFSLSAYLIISIFSSIINLVSPLLFLWAFRNTFRGIIYALICITYIKFSDLKKIFSWLLVIQIISTMLALYQLIILKHEQDYIGGIFGYGNGAGVNTLNILLISYFSFSVILKKEKFWKFLISIFTSLVIAAVAEEKITFFYVIIMIIILICFVKTKKLLKVFIVFSGILFIIFSLNILKILYPNMFTTLTNFDLLLSYASQTIEEGYAIPRIGAFPIIRQLFLTDDFHLFLGIGFGNAEGSSLSFFTSEFYIKYSYYHYRWFTHQWMFIEQGILGFSSYLFIFISITIVFLKRLLTIKDKNNVLLLTSLSCVLCMIVSIWYNSTLKNDMSYIAFFSIFIGYIKPTSSITRTQTSTISNNKYQY